MLKGKTVLLAVCGGIAAYKAAALASLLHKNGAEVRVIMTENAAQFITPLTFESLTGTRCVLDTFERGGEFQVEHIALAKKANAVLVAPATANILGKLAAGLADDMLTTTMLACRCPKMLAPAMNTQMYENPIVQDNIKRLRGYGFEIICPDSGYLACGDTGAGKLPEPPVLLEHILRAIAKPHDLCGRRVLVTAGATAEPLDPVRFLTNHSTGKMGVAVARECMLRGAQVILVHGNMEVEPPIGVTAVYAPTAEKMMQAVQVHAAQQDIIIKAAAVADYRPVQPAHEKLKKTAQARTLELERTGDILAWLGAHRRPGQMLCGFAMETQNLLENAREKRLKKGVDLIAANSLKQEGAGFACNTNILTLISAMREIALPCMSKQEAAGALVDELLQIQKSRRML